MRNPVLLCYWNWVIATISERVPKRHYFFFTAALCRFARHTQAASQPAESRAATRAPSSSPAPAAATAAAEAANQYPQRRTACVFLLRACWGARLAIWGPALPKVSGDLWPTEAEIQQCGGEWKFNSCQGSSARRGATKVLCFQPCLATALCYQYAVLLRFVRSLCCFRHRLARYYIWIRICKFPLLCKFPLWCKVFLRSRFVQGSEV